VGKHEVDADEHSIGATSSAKNWKKDLGSNVDDVAENSLVSDALRECQYMLIIIMQAVAPCVGSGEKALLKNVHLLAIPELKAAIQKKAVIQPASDKPSMKAFSMHVREVETLSTVPPVSR
jgi:hypothetical protein